MAYTMEPKTSGTPTTRAVRAKFTHPARPPLPTMRIGGGMTLGPRTLVSGTGFPGVPDFGRGPRTPVTGVPTTPPPGSAGPAPPPPDPQYDAAVAIAQRNRDARLAALSGQRAQTLNEYGFTPQTDSAGNVTGIAFDPTNHFSKAALMAKAWGEKRAGNTNSMAARGQLYAGSLQNAQDAANAGELQSDDALKRALLAFIADNTAAGTATRSEYENTITQAEADRLGRAADNPLYSPSSEGTSGDAALPSTAGIASAASGGLAAAANRPVSARNAAVARAVATRAKTGATPKARMPRVRLRPSRPIGGGHGAKVKRPGR